MNTYHSKLGNIWRLPGADLELINTIKEKFKTSFLTAQILSNRVEFDKIEQYLDSSLKNNWVDTEKIPNITTGTQKILEAIKKKYQIGVIGDYDVDGLCSSIMTKEFFSHFDMDTHVWLPNRKDGYGPSEKALEFFEKNPVDLLIMVDCGTNSTQFIEKYNKNLLIIDHHHSANSIPDFIINPNATKEPISQIFKELCATSLAFFIFTHILKELKHAKYQEILKTMLDLVAMATVCDMMPFNNVNKALVKAGVKEIEQQNRVGLRQLMNFVNLKMPITSKDLGFTIGPRLNATGRIETPRISFNLLCSQSFEECNEIIHKIEGLNNYRKEIQNQAFKEAIEIAKTDKNEILCLASKNWNAGIVGIVASMIQSEEQKPTIIGNISNGIIKASARSTKLNIGLMIEKAVEIGLLQEGGGHKAAAGLTCTIDKWPEFIKWINENTIQTEDAIIYIDALTTLAEIEIDYKRLAPFGLQNEEPKVLVHNLYATKIIFKDTYYILYLLEGLREFTFFISATREKVIAELHHALANKSKFSAVFSLPEKGYYVFEDLG